MLFFFYSYFLREKEETPQEKQVQVVEQEKEREKPEMSGFKKAKEDAQIRFYEKQAEWAGIGEGED